MKRLHTIILVFILVLMLVMAGCADKNTAQDKNTKNPQGNEQEEDKAENKEQGGTLYYAITKDVKTLNPIYGQSKI